VPLENVADRHFAVGVGALAVEAHRKSGTKRILHVIGPRSSVQRGRMFTSASNPVVLRALMRTTLILVPDALVEQMLQSEPARFQALAESIAEQQTALFDLLAMQAERDTLRRVVRVLLHLDDQMGTPCPLAPGVQLLVNQATVAAIAGVSRQTANQTLRALQSARLVFVERALVCVGNRSALVAAAEGGPTVTRTRGPVTCKFRHRSLPLSCWPTWSARAG
jgi:CRP-like cAMP-binding protein